MTRYIFALSLLLFTVSSAYAKPTRIMLLGDSITEDWAFSDSTSPRPASMKHGYRNYLWYMLQDAHYDVDFVGTRHYGSAIRPKFDIDNEGYSGLTSQQIADGIVPRIEQFAPHIVLLHIGTNDYSTSASGVEHILENIDYLEKKYNFPIKIIVARIMNKASFNNRNRAIGRNSQMISEFNRNIQRMIDKRVAKGDDIKVVDMERHAGLYYDRRDFQDFLHPNNSGYYKMAKVWFKAIKDAMKPIKKKVSQDNSFLVPIYSVLLD